jgi:hypothetical protein
MRVRSWPRVARSVWVATALLGAVALAGFAAGTWAFAPAAVALVGVAVFAAAECGIASAATARALQEETA